MIQVFAYGVLGVVLFAYAAEYLFSIRDDPREPVRLRPKVPLIGHILGLINSGPSYHSQLRYEPAHAMTDIVDRKDVLSWLTMHSKDCHRPGNIHLGHI